MAGSAVVGQLRALLTADTSAFDSAMANASKKTQVWSQDFTKLGLSAQQVGSVIVNSMARSLTAVDNLAKGFSGAGIAKSADEYAAAIGRIGGAERLTASEQAKVNTVVTEAIAKYRALGQEAPAHLLKLADATKQVDAKTQSFSDQLKAAIPNTQSLTTQIQGMALGYVTGTLALAGFERAGRVVLDFVVDSVKAYTASEDAQRRLVTALTAAGQATPHVIEQFTKLAEAYQKTTVNSDEAIKETEALLVQVGGVLPSQMDKALRATTDLAAGLGIDLRAATMLVAKSFEDNFGALKKAGVVIDETRAKSEGMDYVLGQLEKRFGGQAQSEVNSYAGQVKQLGNEYDDLQENVGKLVIDTGLLQTAMLYARLEITKTKAELAGLTGIAKLLIALMPGGMGGLLAGTGKGAAQSELDALRGPMEALMKSAPAVADYSKQLQAAKQHLALLTNEQREDLKAAIDLNVAAATLEKQFHLTAGEIQIFKDQLAAAKTEAAKAAAEAKKLTAVDDELKKAVAELSIEFKNLGDKGIPLDQIMERLGKSADDLVDKWERSDMSLSDLRASILATAMRYQIMTAAQKGASDGVKKLLAGYADLVPAMQHSAQEQAVGNERLNHFRLIAGLTDAQVVALTHSIVLGKEKSRDWMGSLDQLASSFQQMAQIGGDSFSPYLRSIGSAIAATNTLQKAVTAFEMPKAQGGGFSASNIASLAAGYASLVGVFYQVTSAMLRASMNANQLRLHLEAATQYSHDLGTTLSDSLVEAIHKSAGEFDQLEHAIAPIGRPGGLFLTMAAEALHLSEVLQEMGGISAANVGMVIERLGILFKLVSAGGTNAPAALKQIELLMKQLGTAGRGLNDTIKPYLDSLVSAGKITAGMAAAFLASTGQMSASWQELEADANKYGVALSALGPTFEQQKLNSAAEDIAKAFKEMNGVGADTLGILQGMQDEAQAVVTEALNMGLKVPDAMRGMLEQMVKFGLLTDAAGNKLEDLSSIEFAEPIITPIDELVEAIHDLINQLLGLPPAAKKGADGIKSQFDNLDIKIPIEFAYSSTGTKPNFDDVPDFPIPDLPSFAHGTHGRYLDFGAGTPAMLHGRERIVTEGEGGGSTTVVVKSYLNGRLVGEGVTPEVAKYARRKGWTKA
jgi:hypothetical protein